MLRLSNSRRDVVISRNDKTQNEMRRSFKPFTVLLLSTHYLCPEERDHSETRDFCFFDVRQNGIEKLRRQIEG